MGTLKVKKKEGDKEEVIIIEEEDDSLDKSLYEGKTLTEDISGIINELTSKGTEDEDDDALRKEEKEGEEEEVVDDEEGDEEGDEEDDEDLEDEEDDEKEEEQGEDEGEEDEEDDEEVISSSEIKPPASWGEGAKEEFGKLPVKQQESVVKTFKGMQADYTKKLQNISGLVSACEPLKNECVKRGITYEQAVRVLVGAHVQMVEDPAEGIRQVMSAYGVTADQVLGITTESDGDIPKKLSDRLDSIEKKVNTSANSNYENNMDDLAKQVEEFAKDKEYFEEVQGEMGQAIDMHVKAGQPIPPLKDLYSDACWKNQSVKDRMIAKMRTDDSKDKVDRRKKRAAKSKRAAIKKSKSSVTRKKPDTREKGLRGTLESAYDEALTKAGSRAG